MHRRCIHGISAPARFPGQATIHNIAFHYSINTSCLTPGYRHAPGFRLLTARRTTGSWARHLSPAPGRLGFQFTSGTHFHFTPISTFRHRAAPGAFGGSFTATHSPASGHRPAAGHPACVGLPHPGSFGGRRGHHLAPGLARAPGTGPGVRPGIQQFCRFPFHLLAISHAASWLRVPLIVIGTAPTISLHIIRRRPGSPRRNGPPGLFRYSNIIPPIPFAITTLIGIIYCVYSAHPVCARRSLPFNILQFYSISFSRISLAGPGQHYAIRRAFDCHAFASLRR